MLSQKDLHEKILYPIVRVTSEESGRKVGGSGSIIYSKPAKSKEGEYQTFVLTNHHVVAGAITVKKDWESILKREIKKEFLEEVEVEIFDYINLSTVVSSNVHKAAIVAYDQSHDLALLKLASPRQIEYTAQVIPKEKIKDLQLFDPIMGCGCSLLHNPFATDGRITSLKEAIENKNYFMTSQNSIFGNSGGAMYLAETGEQIGVTARITGIQLGFGVDIMTWMGFCVAPERLYEFFDEQELRFLYDESDTYEAAMKRREKKQRAMMMRLLKAEAEEDEEGEESTS